MFVPVISKTGKPLMPTNPVRARKLIKAGKAVGKFKKGLFYIQLTEREDGEVQEIVVGVDPGSKKEGFSIKSQHHTYLNIQTDAVDWVSKHLETRRMMRRSRRQRNTPYRKCRSNRLINSERLPASTRARWNWKLRILNWLIKLFPIVVFIVEDIKAKTFKNGKKWNMSFSPLEVGKKYFYKEIEKLGKLELKQGYETAELRENAGLKKSSQKLSSKFEAHCIDSWVLANWYVGGHIEPDNKEMMLISPVELHRRQLHRLEPEKDGKRKRYGGTMSLGLKRGSLVKHIKFGLCYVGGYLKDRISLHHIETGKRLTQLAKVQDCVVLNFNTWRNSNSSPA